jgi:hypothetical protein
MVGLTLDANAALMRSKDTHLTTWLSEAQRSELGN